ncbi:MAG: hypothetical protein ACRDYB_12560, partial [Acidimicrobiales bacterium]
MTSFCPLGGGGGSVDRGFLSWSTRVRRWTMDDVRTIVERRLAAAFDAVAAGADPVLRTSDRADLQANGAIALARAAGRPPAEIARDVVEALDIADICREVEISGNGFINLTYAEEF